MNWRFHCATTHQKRDCSDQDANVREMRHILLANKRFESRKTLPISPVAIALKKNMVANTVMLAEMYVKATCGFISGHYGLQVMFTRANILVPYRAVYKVSCFLPTEPHLT